MTRAVMYIECYECSRDPVTGSTRIAESPKALTLQNPPNPVFYQACNLPKASMDPNNRV